MGITWLPRRILSPGYLGLSVLEQLRDLYNWENFGLMLIGMRGLEKCLVRYPQLYSRVWFVYTFHALSDEEAQWLLKQHWGELDGIYE
jgi:hypothetical protein